MSGEKLVSLEEAAALVRDGQTLALGGNLLYRIPAAFARELARQGRKGLRLVKTAGNYEIDLLCRSGSVSSVVAGFVSFEGEFGLAQGFRRAVEEGRVRFEENACYTVIAALRAAAYGVPFMPVADLGESHLPSARGFRRVENPYGGGEVLTVPALVPDWAVLHVQEADRRGNAVVRGPLFEDVLMARAARGVILTAEEVVGEVSEPDLALVPGFKVAAVVHLPGGARPGACPPTYDYSPVEVAEYLYAAERGELQAYLEKVRP
jgi:glutaconate CoA-transferase subunit A